MHSSPTSSAAHSRPVPTSTVRSSAIGTGQPTDEIRASSWPNGMSVVGDDVSVIPYAFCRVACGSHSRSATMPSGGVGAPP